jgi:hypothetical protein
LPFFHIFHIFSQFSSVFSISYHYSTWVCSLFFISFHNSTWVSSIFFISFHYSTYLSSIFSRLFHISTYFSSVFSKSFHYSTYFSSFLTHSLTQLTQWYSQHNKLLKFSCDLNLFQRIPIALKYIVFSSYLNRVLGNAFQLSETSINSYDISFMYKLPWYNCNIVECGIIHHQLNLLFTKIYTYLPIYLHFYKNYRFYSFFASHFPILMSFRFSQSNSFYITA